MRLAELSDRSGVPVATIKYYLREGLLPPGNRVAATQADYGEEHLRRLRLARALIQIGRVPVATAREVLAAAHDDTLNQGARLGTAVAALPPDPEPDDGDPATTAARHEADRLFSELGWHCARSGTREFPAHRTLITALATLLQLGYPCDLAHLLPYARTAEALAAHDLDTLEEYGTPVERVEAAVALTVLYEPVLLSLRRLAHAQVTVRRSSDAGCGESEGRPARCDIPTTPPEVC